MGNSASAGADIFFAAELEHGPPGPVGAEKGADCRHLVFDVHRAIAHWLDIGAYLSDSRPSGQIDTE